MNFIVENKAYFLGYEWDIYSFTDPNYVLRRGAEVVTVDKLVFSDLAVADYYLIQQMNEVPRAPANAQKNSDITKQEIENKLTGVITTHSHPSTGSGSEEFVIAMAVAL